MAGNGLRHGRSQGMDGYTGNLAEFPINPANTDTIFMGDAVVLNAGYIEEASSNVAGDLAAGPILGVFMGYRNKASQARIGANDTPFAQHWSGAPNIADPVAHVALPAHSTFIIKGSAGSTYAQADVGKRYLIKYAAGNPNTGQSRISLGAVNAAGPLQLHRLVDLPGNSWGSAEPLLEVVVVAQQGTAADVA